MNNRDYAIDFIRLAAILAVVIIHASTYFLDVTSPFTFNFYVLHTINQLFRFAVPAFFAISGFLLGSRYANISSPITFYKKRLSRILLPYLIWSLFYFLIIFPNPIKLLFSTIFLHDIFTGDSSFQLYFIPAIIFLYSLFPLIIYFKKLLLTIWFIFSLFILETVILSYVYFFEPKITISAPFVIGFFNLLPFLIGIYAAHNFDDLKSFIKSKIKIFWLVSVFSWILIFSESVLMFKNTGKPMYLRDQWRISVTIYGVAAAALLYYYYRVKWNKISSYLSSFSFGVFFVHVAILHNILRVFYAFKLYDLVSFFISLGLTITLSFLFSIVFSKIKIVNKLLGLRS